MRWLLFALADRCPIHDRAWPRLIAELERDTGLNPGAFTELLATHDLVDSYADPRLIDCGRRRCRARRKESNRKG